MNTVAESGMEQLISGLLPHFWRVQVTFEWGSVQLLARPYTAKGKPAPTTRVMAGYGDTLTEAYADLSAKPHFVEYMAARD